jgi:hypothetical protein
MYTLRRVLKQLDEHINRPHYANVETYFFIHLRRLLLQLQISPFQFFELCSQHNKLRVFLAYVGLQLQSEPLTLIYMIHVVISQMPICKFVI